MTSTNAVIYARFSSHNQQEQSIEGQIRVCSQFAERQGYNVVKIYADRAISGTTDNRPQFQQMIQDAAAKQFSYIIVWKLDRFSRDRYDSAIYKHKLRGYGVKVISATEGIGEGNEANLLEALLEAMAENYSKQLSQNVKRGMRETALKGNVTSGVAPFGYKIIDKKFVPDEKTAPVLKYIYEQYAAGVPKTQIAEDLNQKGYRTSTGGKFNKGSFNSIICNPRHIGTYVCKDIILENAIEPVVDKELFERCKKRLDHNKRLVNNPHTKVEYILTGKLFCGHCGTLMVGDKAKSKTGKIYHYYTCNKKKKSRCDKKREHKDFIEWYVCEQAVEYITQEGRLNYIAENVVKEYNKRYSDIGIAETEKEIKRLNKRLDEITEMMIGAKLKRVIDRLNKEAEQIDAELTEAENRLVSQKILAKAKLKASDVKNYLAQFAKGDLMDMEFRKQVINTLINAVYLFDDKVIIYFNAKEAKQVSYIEMLDDKELFECEEQEKSSTANLSAQPEILAVEHCAVLMFRSSIFALFMKRTE